MNRMRAIPVGSWLLVPPGKHPSQAKNWVREGMVIAWRTLSEFSVRLV
jgi:hypothetical protein